MYWLEPLQIGAQPSNLLVPSALGDPRAQRVFSAVQAHQSAYTICTTTAASGRCKTEVGRGPGPDPEPKPGPEKKTAPPRE